MSVLIKGMKMPHSCIGCRFCEHGSINEWDLYCSIDNKHVGNWDDKHINNGWRHPDCPLVPVPTLHGRLIDCETLKDDLAVLLERNEKLIDEWLAYAIDDVIDEVPTIIEAEEGEEDDEHTD